METGLDASNRTRRAHNAVPTSRGTGAIHIAIRMSIADERIRATVEAQTIVTKAPLNSEYPKIFIIFPF